MKYFNYEMTLDEVKKTYRQMAMKLHPDQGGNEAEMIELNNQFEIAFTAAANKVHSKETVRRFYTENGWAGKRYDMNLSTTDIAKKIREYVKYTHPTYRFSVTTSCYSGGSSIRVSLTEYPVELTNYERMRKYADKNYRDYTWVYLPSTGSCQVYTAMTEEEKVEAINYKVQTANDEQLNSYYLQETTWLNPVILNVLLDVRDFINSYRYDDSDSMTDYFCTNFYYNIDIGRGSEKPAKYVERVARISPNKATKAKKIA